MTPKLRHLIPAALATTLSLAGAGPAAAATTSHRHLAAPHAVTGVVLEARHHTLRLAAASGAVRSYTVGRLPASVRRGARVRFTASGHAARKLTVLSHARQLSFLARVVRSRSGKLVVATGDGGRVELAAGRAKVKRAAASPRRRSVASRRHALRAHIAPDVLPISVQGLQPGQAVRVTLNLSPAGDELALTITLLPAPFTAGPAGAPAGAPGGAPAAGATTLAGTVVAVDEENSSFTVLDAQGNETDVTLSDALIAAADTLPAVCDTVALATHPDPSADGSVVADAVRTTGTDSSGACDSSGADAASGDQEVVGAVSALDPVAGTLTVTPTDGAPVTVSSDPTLLDGLAPGDQVDLFYADAGDGTFALDALLPADPAVGGDPSSAPVAVTVAA